MSYNIAVAMSDIVNTSAIVTNGSLLLEFAGSDSLVAYVSKSNVTGKVKCRMDLTFKCFRGLFRWLL